MKNPIYIKQKLEQEKSRINKLDQESKEDQAC